MIALTKSDLCPDLARKTDQVVACSAMDEDGYRAVTHFIAPGKTIAFIGSSGVGKSTLINRLLGQELPATGAVRAGDRRGRHTTHWQRLPLPRARLDSYEKLRRETA